MNAIVDPDGPKFADIPLNPIPPGARTGFMTTSDKVRLRYGTWPKTAGAAKGTVCILQGRTEFIEKYFETITDLQKRGFAVATFDFRGQGGSDRLIRNPSFGYVDRFDDYWTDLKDFHQQILLPECPPPFYLLAHSMGGLVALNAATKDRLMFDRMILSAPMIALDGMPFGPSGMAGLAETLSFLGLGAVPMKRRADAPASEQTFPGNPLTSDLNRYLRNIETAHAIPGLEITSPTIRWAASSFRMMARAASDDFPLAVKVPVLMLAAARDEVVSTSATEALGLRMRLGRHAVIATARHELLQENDDVRSQVFAAFDTFITNQTPM